MVEEITELLRSIGFSDDQSRIYLNLLNTGERENIDQAMTNLGVPPDRAESAIKSLVDRGMLRVTRNQLEVVSPRESLAVILEQKRRQSESQLRDVETIILAIQKSLEPIYWEKSVGIRSEEIIDTLPDLEEMELQTVKIIGSARERISIFAQTFGWYSKVREELYHALDRRVKTRVLMTATDETSTRLSKELMELGVEVRLFAAEWYPIRGTLGDNSELVFLIWATKKDAPKPIHYYPHYTRNIGLISIFSDAFDLRWDQAKPL
ncbi:MAG: helix-turn-helix domain-containing protein [archaeon]